MGINKFRGIWNCPTLQLPLLDFQCPQSWHALPDSGNLTVRHCPTCKKDVHLCQTPEEYVQAGEQGHCVAVPDTIQPIHLVTCLIGQPSTESVKAFKSELGQVVAWWSEIIEKMPESLGDELEPMRNAVENRKADC